MIAFDFYPQHQTKTGREAKSAIRDLLNRHSGIRMEQFRNWKRVYLIMCLAMWTNHNLNALDGVMKQSRQIAQFLRGNQGYHGQSIFRTTDELCSRSQLLQLCLRPNKLTKDRRSAALVLHSGRHDSVTQACCLELARMGSDVAILFVDADAAASAETAEAVHLVEHYGGKAVAIAGLPFWKVKNYFPPEPPRECLPKLDIDGKYIEQALEALGSRDYFDIIGSLCFLSKDWLHFTIRGYS